MILKFNTMPEKIWLAECAALGSTYFKDSYKQICYINVLKLSEKITKLTFMLFLHFI